MHTVNELVRFLRLPYVSEYYWGKVGVVVGWIRELNMYQIELEDCQIIVPSFAFTVLGDV